MDLKKALAKFHSQKHGAHRRGIEWQLTFRQWLDWWGADLERRGRGADQLQMQRVGDVGPYALGNIRKGHPRQNARTYSAALQNRKSVAANVEWQASLDAAPVGERHEEEIDPEEMSISEYFAQGKTDAVIRRCKSDVITGR